MGLLDTPLKIGDITLKNRIVMPPMVKFKKEGSSWKPNDEHIGYYSRRARAGTGLVVVEATAIDAGGRLAQNQLRAWDDTFIPELARLAKAIKEGGTAALIQIHHAGANTSPGCLDGEQPVAPSPVPSRRHGAAVPRALRADEIESLIQKYADAALRCVKAGFDGVEIHGAHGYLLSQFLSPAYNHRSDMWGGTSLESRLAMPLAVVRAVRSVIGDKALMSYRLGVAESFEGGLQIDEGVQAAIALEETKCLNLLSISTGMGGASSPPKGFEFSGLMYLGSRVKPHVKLPVVAVGGIRKGQEAERALQAGVADLIAVGKAMLADPEWSRKALDMKDEDIITCLQCKRCGYFTFDGTCPRSPRERS